MRGARYAWSGESECVHTHRETETEGKDIDANAVRHLAGAPKANGTITTLEFEDNTDDVTRHLHANLTLRGARRAAGPALTAAWVRARRAGAELEPLASIPRELVTRIVVCMSRDGDASPLDGWSDEERARW